MLELRRLASSYRHRAEGTHFVQVHLADIEGEDDVEEAASTTSSCSVCHHQQPPIAPPSRSHESNIPPTKSHDPIIPVTKTHTRAPPTKPHDIKAPPTGSHDSQDDTESNSSTPTNNTHQDTEPPTGQPYDHKASADESDHGRPQGRLPTPELKEIPPARKIRHHLDRTTPCKGAILTSPPKKVYHGWNPEEEDEDPLTDPVHTIPPGVTKILPRYRRDMTSCVPIYPSHTTHTTDHQERQPNITIRKKPGATSNRKTVTKQHGNLHKTQTQVSSQKTTTAASRKVKVTENDDLECSFCGSPLRQPTHKRLITDNRPLAMHKIGTAQPTTKAPQQLRKTPQLPLSQHLSQQQKPLSGSLLSLSSCSVASEVLQRAQHRKATFWNQKGTTAT